MEDFKILVDIKRSPVHGVGVFAKQDIEPFTKLCLYEGEDIPNDQVDKKDNYLMPHPLYSGVTRQGYTLNKIKRRYGVGQLINDACKPDIDVTKTYTYQEIAGILAKYIKCSNKNKNVRF